MAWLNANKALNAIRGIPKFFAPGDRVKNMKMMNDAMKDQIEILRAQLKQVSGKERDELSNRIAHMEAIRGIPALSIAGAYLDENPYRTAIIGTGVASAVLAYNAADSRDERRR